MTDKENKIGIIDELRSAEDAWIEERAKRLEIYQSIFYEEYQPLRSTVSIIFFVEIMYNYVYGAYVSCIVMCHLVCMEVLKAPFNISTEEEIFEYGFSKLVKENKKRGWIDNEMVKDLIKLNNIRNNFSHSKKARRIIKDLDKGKKELAELYDPNSYQKLESNAIFAMSLVHRLIWDSRLMFSPSNIN